MLLRSAFFIESYYPSNPLSKQHFFNVSQLLRMLPRRGNFRPLEVPQIKMFEATLQIISGLWWKVKWFCVCSKKYLLVYSFCFSTHENGPVFGSRNATWRFTTQMKFLNQRNGDLVTRMSSKQFKEFESLELLLSIATNNSNNQNSSWVLVVLHFSTCTKWQCRLRAFSTWASWCFPPGQHATHMSPLFRAVKVWTFSWL